MRACVLSMRENLNKDLSQMVQTCVYQIWKNVEMQLKEA